MQVTMKTEAGARLTWTAARVETWMFNGRGARPKCGKGWEFTDESGYTRWGGWTWKECAARIQATAANYGYTTTAS